MYRLASNGVPDRPAEASAGAHSRVHGRILRGTWHGPTPRARAFRMTVDRGSLVVVTASNAGHRFSARRDVEQAPSPGGFVRRVAGRVVARQPRGSRRALSPLVLRRGAIRRGSTGRGKRRRGAYRGGSAA